MFEILKRDIAGRKEDDDEILRRIGILVLEVETKIGPGMIKDFLPDILSLLGEYRPEIDNKVTEENIRALAGDND